MSKEFRYRHSVRDVTKRRQVVALGDFVEKCLGLNALAFAVAAMFAGWSLLSGYRIAWGLLVSLLVTWWVALGVSLVMTVRLGFRMLLNLKNSREVGWVNIGMAMALGFGTWAVSWGMLAKIFTFLYIAFVYYN